MSQSRDFFETSQLGPQGWDRGIPLLAKYARNGARSVGAGPAYECRGPSLGGLRLARRSPLPQDDKSRMCSLLLILFGRKKRIWSGPPNCGNCFVAGTAELCGADDRATPAAGGDHVTVGRVECEDRIFGGRSAGSLALSQALGGDRHHSRGSVLIARAPGGWLRRDDVRGGVVVAGGGELDLLTGKSRRGSGGADGDGLELAGHTL